MNFYCIKFSKFKKSKNIKIILEVIEIINLYFHGIEYCFENFETVAKEELIDLFTV